MLKISNIKLKPGYTNDDLKISIAKKLKISKYNIDNFSVVKRSLDARKKDNINFVITVKADVKTSENKILKNAKSKDISLYKKDKYKFITVNKAAPNIIIVGSGPAGLFAAYTMVKSGLKPIIIERGEKIEDRIKSVNDFFNGGELNIESNIQFGEGGAGTFSDGKLNTGISDSRIRLVLETFVKFGAPSEILIEQKPHIGTDILRKLIINFRRYLEDNGAEFMFSTKFINFTLHNGKIHSAIIEQNGITKEILCDNIVLAIGHSARDTFHSLYENKVPMKQKPFAVGARIEHSQEFINQIQYGKEFKNPLLPVADYKTAVHLENGRSVYSFCMCPGGYVVAAASEHKMIAVNGMSNFKRDGKNANSALLVNVVPADFNSDHPLAGIEIQREIEKKAFNITESYKAPAQTLNSFLYGGDNEISSVSPTYRPDIFLCDLAEVLPEFVSKSLKEGILLINNTLKGFADKNAVLTAPETRSSSPVRILRNDNFSSDIIGLFPCGEGAGYAGGITSAAVDGIKVAEKIVNSYI